MRAGRGVLAAAATAGALVLAGCGVPTGGRPDAIPPSAVPYGLASVSPSAPAATSAPVEQDQPRIYLVLPDEALVPMAREIPQGTVRERLSILLKYLAAGPTGEEKRHRLSTSLPPDVRLGVGNVSAGTATIDIGGTSDAPSGRASRRAVAQIVLTATSLPEVHDVLLSSDGTQVEAPLPSGELTSSPLSAADYAPLLVGPTPAPSATP